MGTDKRERQKAGRQARIEAARIAQKKAEQRAKVLRIGIVAFVAVAVIAGLAIFQRRNQDQAAGSPSTAPGSSAPATGGPAAVPPPPAGKTVSGETPCPAADGSSERTTKFEKAPPMCIDPNKTYKATMDTSMGTVKLTLDTKKTPGTTNNFVVLSRYKYYDGTALFRVDPSIDIIQGGAPGTNSASDPGPGYTINDEGGKFTYKEGQIVMARTDAPNSSGAQFFLTTGPKVSSLDSQGTYLLFGDVTEGLDVLKAILGSGVEFPADSPMAGLGSGPKDAVLINKVTIEES
jgi:cyclophilin family peptidyl-prolyl cis-trans isomerase